MAKAKNDKKNTADIGFEKQLWAAANALRGNLDATEYKNVVLGLIFLKYLSDRFDERYQELVAEGYGDEEDHDCYMEKMSSSFPKKRVGQTSPRQLTHLKSARSSIMPCVPSNTRTINSKACCLRISRVPS